ncbi:MAG: helix-turn-helix transcriptional regulator [Georgenia sp.]
MSQRPADTGTEQARTASRRRVLEVVRANPDGCGVPEVARGTDLHPNTVRFHLDRLEQVGLVSRRIQHSGEPGRPPLTYVANSVPDAGRGHREFAQLAQVLATLVEQLSPAPASAAIEAGRSWGLARTAHPAGPTAAADALDTLVTTLGEVGFVPETDVSATDVNATGVTIVQRHCPFLEVAQNHQDVVCSLHLGLMRGVLERLDTPVTAEHLVPFAGPAGCEAHLTIAKGD